MQAAQPTSQTVFGPPGSPDETGPGRLTPFDDPEEWAVFSQRCGEKTGAADAATGLWESHVVVRGMHCAACALTLEHALLGVKGGGWCQPACCLARPGQRALEPGAGASATWRGGCGVAHHRFRCFNAGSATG